MLLKTSFVIGGLWLAGLGPTGTPAATPPKSCVYARYGAETARFLGMVDRVYSRLQAEVVRAHPTWAADYATNCFALNDKPGDFVRLVERRRHVQLTPDIMAGYYRRVGESNIVKVVRFRSSADAQRCAAAIEEARAWARTQPYNPEFTEPLRTDNRVLVCGPFLVNMMDGFRGAPDLQMEYRAFRGRFYEALQKAKP